MFGDDELELFVERLKHHVQRNYAGQTLTGDGLVYCIDHAVYDVDKEGGAFAQQIVAPPAPTKPVTDFIATTQGVLPIDTVKAKLDKSITLRQLYPHIVGHPDLEVLVVKKDGTYLRVEKIYTDDIGGPGECRPYLFLETEE